MTRNTPERERGAQTTASPTLDVGKHRLPCRGCTRGCRNYARCNGKPWRL